MAFAPSFSKLELAERCLGPWTLRLKWPKVQAPNAYRGIGRAMSDAALCLSTWGDYPHAEIVAFHELGEADARKLTICARHVRELLEEEARTDRWRKAEVPLAYNLRTGGGREMRKEHARDYSDERPDERSGTPDLVRMRADGVLVVRDWKMGRYMYGRKASSALQVRALCLTAARAYGAHAVVPELVQVDEDGLRHSPPELFTAFDLAVIEGELRGIYGRLEGPPEPPRPGPWCANNYCPVVANCPATVKSLAAVAQATELKHPLTHEFTSAEHVGYVLERLDAAEMMLETLREAAKQWVRANGAVPLGDGKAWGPVVQKGRESIDLSVGGALEAIERHLGAFGAAAAIEKKTSKTAIASAAKLGQSKRGEGVQKVRALFDELHTLGAIKVGAPWEKFEEFDPPPADTADTEPVPASAAQ